jgi:hypothetical protein
MRLLNHTTEASMPGAPILKPASLFIYIGAMFLTCCVVFLGQPGQLVHTSLANQLIEVGWRVFVLLFVMGAGAVIWVF